MKTRWLVLSLALVAVAAVAAVAFSSQPGETSHGVSRGIILWVLDWLHLEVSEETMCPSHHLFLHGPWLGFGISMAEESGSLDTGYDLWGGFRSLR